MQTAGKTGVAALVAGLSATVIGVAVPLAFPTLSAPFWKGVVFVGAIVLVLAIIYLVYLHFDWRKRLAPLMLMIVGGLMFFVGASWYGITFFPTGNGNEDHQPPTDGTVQKLSDLSPTQLRERASRFTAQLREFEAEHALEERRISEQETQEMLRQLPVITAEDRERESKIWSKNQLAMTERRAEYQR